MTARAPLTIISGGVSELPSGDTLRVVDRIIRVVSIVLNDSTPLSAREQQFYYRIPEEFDGYNLISVRASRAGGTGIVEMQITNRSVGSAATMLSTHLTIDDEEIDSSTAAVPAVIDTDNDNVAAGDQLSIDGISAGTDTVWFQIQMAFQLP